MLNDTLTRLQKMTVYCREDMHEPDEQGISAEVVGNHLDNAFGTSEVAGELIVKITREYSDGGKVTDSFNLADLIALARKAQL